MIKFFDPVRTKKLEHRVISARSEVFSITFFCERLRNPGFSFIGDASFRKKKKSGFLPRADIKNLWSGTYLTFLSLTFVMILHSQRSVSCGMAV
ncbi:Uncharacterized protein dnm_029300 [Desulfonema magnum]|uniref:Uncharacterized protein n=1 Tax=Desulfonema magnum TaxID=45655 RepID=A0A975BKT0_9BACT|nr:Uncharacterized protein dnm_029300 [Desulfonema magnum]